MIAVVQRVKSSSVTVENQTVGKIDHGLMVLLGVADTDTPSEIDFLADKTINLRIFEDADGKMNRSLLDIGGQMLVVSQFTLLGDCSRGRRPSFIHAAEPVKAEDYYMKFAEKVRRMGVPVETGQFRAMMDVALVNHGPVTMILKSKNHVD